MSQGVYIVGQSDREANKGDVSVEADTASGRAEPIVFRRSAQSDGRLELKSPVAGFAEFS